MYNRKFNNIDLAIIVVSETQLILPVEKSPYYLCKAKYRTRHSNSSCSNRKIKSSGLKYIINNVALNTYAKLGVHHGVLKRLSI